LDPAAAAPRILVADLSSTPPAAASPITVLGAGTVPVALAVVSSTGPDRLAVADTAGGVQLLAINPPELLGTSTPPLAHKPIALVTSPDGDWVYILEADNQAGDSFIQAVNTHLLALKQISGPGPTFQVGPAARGVAINSTGDRLYVPYVGAVGPPPIAGGVALVDVNEQDCEEILWRHLEGCPDCRDGKCTCIILATIDHYAPGFA